MILLLHVFFFVSASLMIVPPTLLRSGWIWTYQIISTEWPVLYMGLIVASIFSNWFFTIYLVPYFWFIRQRYDYKLMFACSEQASHFQFSNTKTPTPWRLLLRNLYPFQSSPRPDAIIRDEKQPDCVHYVYGNLGSDRILLHFHGGSWKHGTHRQLIFIQKLFKAMNIAVVSINYPKVPSVGLAELVESVEFSFLQLCDRFPNTPKILYGRSAGGHLVLHLANKFPDKISKVIALYPVTDFETFAARSTSNDILKSMFLIKDLFGEDWNQKTTELQRWSPTRTLPDQLPPTLIVHGENDPVVNISQSDLYFQIASKRNLPITYLKFKYATHGFDALWNGLSMITFKKVLIDFLN